MSALFVLYKLHKVIALTIQSVLLLPELQIWKEIPIVGRVKKGELEGRHKKFKFLESYLVNICSYFIWIERKICLQETATSSCQDTWLCFVFLTRETPEKGKH